MKTAIAVVVMLVGTVWAQDGIVTGGGDVADPSKHISDHDLKVCRKEWAAMAQHVHFARKPKPTPMTKKEIMENVGSDGQSGIVSKPELAPYSGRAGIISKSEPMDVPAIILKCSNPSFDDPDPQHGTECCDGKWPYCHPEGITTCADKSRILLTAEDNSKHCVKFN